MVIFRTELQNHFVISAKITIRIVISITASERAKSHGFDDIREKIPAKSGEGLRENLPGNFPGFLPGVSEDPIEGSRRASEVRGSLPAFFDEGGDRGDPARVRSVFSLGF